MQLLSQKGPALSGKNNEENLEQLMRLIPKVGLLLEWRKSKKSTFIMIPKMKSYD